MVTDELSQNRNALGFATVTFTDDVAVPYHADTRYVGRNCFNKVVFLVFDVEENFFCDGLVVDGVFQAIALASFLDGCPQTHGNDNFLEFSQLVRTETYYTANS